MNQTIVIYQSSYGFSERYAKWIAEELECQAIQTKEVHSEMLKKYETIIYCGGLYAGRIAGFSLIVKNVPGLKEKDIAVVAVGVSYEDEKMERSLKDQNVTAEMKDQVEFFYLQGGMDFSKMNWFHRLLMKVRKWVTLRKNKDEWTSNDQGFIESYGKSVDFTSQEKVKPIVEWVRNKGIFSKTAN